MRFSFLIVAVIALTSTANAQSVSQIFQSTINRKGKSCQAVTTYKGFATVENGDTLVAVACSGGERYVLRIAKGNKVSFVSTCDIFEMTAKVQCFSKK